MIRTALRRLGKRLGPQPIDARFLQAATSTYFTLAELANGRRDQNESVIRGLCYNAYLGDRTTMCRVLGRYKMFVDTEDMGVSVHLIGDGFWEMWHTEVMLDLLKPGMKAVDIGANLGYFSLLMSDLVGEAGSVHCFEPNSAVAARLRRTLAVNGFADRATVYEQALGNRSGTARLKVPLESPGGGHVLREDVDEPGTDIRIERFDAIAALADADYIKIDAEGSEHEVWRGMRNLLARGRPLTVIVEFTADRYLDPEAFVDEIVTAGFSLEVIHAERGIVPIDRATLLSKPVEEQLLLLRR